MCNCRENSKMNPLCTHHPTSAVINLLLAFVSTFLRYEVQNTGGDGTEVGTVEFNLCSML